MAAAVVAWKVVDDDQANSVGTVGSWRELGSAHSDSGYVAVDEAGQPYTPDALTRKWHKITAQVAQDHQDRRSAADPAARRTPLLRHRFASARGAAGGDREMARPRRRRDDSAPVRALPGRRVDGRREEFGGSCDILVTLRLFSAVAGPVTTAKMLVRVVPPAGFEPAAFCSGGRRSIP